MDSREEDEVPVVISVDSSSWELLVAGYKEVFDNYRVGPIVLAWRKDNNGNLVL